MRYGILTFNQEDHTSHRKIIHLDMDAFYASIEERRYPALKNKPLVIAKHPRKTGGRGVVTTCNYQARKKGIHSAMSAKEAYERCPKAVFIPPDIAYYREVSQAIRQIFSRFTALIEPISVDEAFLDVTQNHLGEKSAIKLARLLQETIWREQSLTASAGISFNKFLAKLASDLHKPAGLTVITADIAQDFLFQLPIDDFYGVGQKTATRLKALGVHTGRDLYACSYEDLINRFGKMGHSLYLHARGIDRSPVNPHRERKSISHELTFNPPIKYDHLLYDQLKVLSDKVADACQKHQLHGNVVHIKIRYANFDTLIRQRKLDNFINSADQFYDVAINLWKEYGDKQQPVRLLGIGVQNLYPLNFENMVLPLE